jgi:hypothetical protein
MPLIRLLNGDLISIDNGREVVSTLSEILDVFPTQIVVVVGDQDQDEKTEHADEIINVMISESPTVTIKGAFRFGGIGHRQTWLEKCCNVSILSHNLAKLRNVFDVTGLATILANPHPVVVDYILVHLKWLIDPTNHRSFLTVFSNPSDRVVDRLFQVLKKLSVHEMVPYGGYMSGNSNPRIVAFLIAHPDLISAPSFAGNSNDDAVTWALSNTREQAEICRNKSSNVAVKYQMKMAKKVPSYHSILLRTAGSSSNDLLISWFLAEVERQYLTASSFVDFFVPPDLLSNPHERAVEWVFAHISAIHQEHEHHLCRNSNERVVEYVLADPGRWIRFPQFLSNTHPRAITYCREHSHEWIDHLHTHPYRAELAKNPHLVIHLLHRDQFGMKDGEWLESVLSSVENLIVKYEPSFVSEKVNTFEK